MKISARTRYGLRILLDIARHRGDGSLRTIAEIASSQTISAAFISRLAVPLKRAGLINSERGVGGGLSLAKNPGEISLLDIMEALDGPVSIVKCVALPKICKRNKTCKVRGIWDGINSAIKNSLASITLASIMADYSGLKSVTSSG